MRNIQITGIFVVYMCCALMYAADPQPIKTREIQIKVVDAITAEPIADVKGSYFVSEGQYNPKNLFTFTTNSRGEAKITISVEAQAVIIRCGKDKFVPGTKFLETAIGQPIVDSCTLKLRRSIVVGGLVQDEKGEPFPGVTIRLEFEIPDLDEPNELGSFKGTAVTDKFGRWEFDGAPSKSPQIMLGTVHRGTSYRSVQHRLGEAEFKEMLEKKLVTVVKRGVSVKGVLLDHDDRPVKNAEVGLGTFGTNYSQSSDEDGRFFLNGLEVGRNDVVVRANGFAPRLIQTLVEKDGQTTEIRLKKGRTRRLKAIDKHGKPVADATVIVRPWADHRAEIALSTKTDSDGRVVWNDAPESDLKVEVVAAGFMSFSDGVPWAADKEELVVVMTKPVSVQGKVVDDETGKPIPAFEVKIQVTVSERDIIISNDRGTAGHYSTSVTTAGAELTVEIRASGYLPSTSPVIKGADERIRFDARLKRAPPM
jgi:Carboxypeptidase regulatory-like domain